MRHVGGTTYGALVAVAAVLTLVGCSGQENSAEPGTSSPSSESAAPVEIEPATGPLLRTEVVRLRAPEGWNRAEPILADSAVAESGSSFSSMLLFDGSQIGERTLSEMVGYLRDDFAWRRRADRLDNVDLDGVTAYALSGLEPGYSYNYVWGTQAYGRDIQIELSLDTDIPARKRDAIADSVLASFEWTAD